MQNEVGRRSVSLLRAHWFNLVCLAWSKLRRRCIQCNVYPHRLMFGNGTNCTLLAINYTITPPPHTPTTTPTPPARYAQRSALQLHFAWFATMMDIERPLHPSASTHLTSRTSPQGCCSIPRRVVYGEAVVSRGLERVAASSPAACTLVVYVAKRFVGRVTHGGIFVGDTATGSKAPANTTAAMQFPRVGNNGALVPVGFAIDGAKV